LTSHNSRRAVNCDDAPAPASIIIHQDDDLAVETPFGSAVGGLEAHGITIGDWSFVLFMLTEARNQSVGMHFIAQRLDDSIVLMRADPSENCTCELCRTLN
jgi:hypothetical protein